MGDNVHISIDLGCLFTVSALQLVNKVALNLALMLQTIGIAYYIEHYLSDALNSTHFSVGQILQVSVWL